MNWVAIEAIEQHSVPESCKPILAYRQDEDSAKVPSKIVESIVDRRLAIGSMPA